MSDTDSTETHRTPDPLGLLVVALDGAAVGRIDDGDIVVHRTFDRQVRRALPGNADDGREERERERAAFYDRVADAAATDLPAVEALAIGGTVTDVDDLREVLPDPLLDRVVTTETIEYGGKKGLKQLRLAVVDDTDGVERFFDALGDGRAVYGEGDVHEAIADGSVETLFVASSLSPGERDDLEAIARTAGATIVVVDAETDRGSQFTTAFGGIGAVLDE